MLFAKLDSAETYAAFLGHAIWREALDWIRRMQPTQQQGVFEVRAKQMYVNVHGYETLPRENCRFESHRTYIDLQYCISGGEVIEWCPVDVLQPRDEYNGAKDVLHYRAPAVPGGTLRMTPGRFAVFFPPDGHMPKLADGVNPRVEKLVIKIAKELLV